MLQHILADHLKLPKRAPVASLDMMGDHMDVDPPHSVNGNALTNGAPLTNGATPSPATSTDSVQFDFAAADAVKYSCKWTARGCCSRTSDSHPSLPSSTEGGAPTGLRTRLFIRHIATHLPSSSLTSSQISPPTTAATSSKSLTPAAATTAFKIQILEDETGDAAGVPLRAALVLRNIAHFMPARFQPALPASAKDIAAAYGLIAPGETPATPTKPTASKRGRTSTGGGGETTDSAADALTTTPSKTNKPSSSDINTGTTPGSISLMTAIFPSDIRERFFLAVAHCRPLRDPLAQILRAIKRAEGNSLDSKGRVVGEEFLVESAKARLLKKLKGDADAEEGDSVVA
jgi:chromatin structure-remodeling complex subunit RSC9